MKLFVAYGLWHPNIIKVSSDSIVDVDSLPPSAADLEEIKRRIATAAEEKFESIKTDRQLYGESRVNVNITFFAALAD